MQWIIGGSGKRALAIGIAAVLVAATGCRPPCEKVDPNMPWHGDNRSALDAFLANHGMCSASYVAGQAPLAAFDWDNTVVKNDVGDAMFFHLLRHDEIFQPPGLNWRLTSPFLTAAAVAALDAACGSLAAAGTRLPTSSNAPCAGELLSIYVNGRTRASAAAWSGWNHRRMEPSYAWLAQLLAGHSRAEISTLVNAAMTENLANAIGTTQDIGGTQVAHWVRIYEPIQDLIGRQRAAGFDVWVISASPQLVVETWAAQVGISADHVIGIRTLEVGGKLDYNLQGCGDVPDGSNDGAGNVTGNSLITYIEGKRCWLNKVVHGDSTAGALQRNADVNKRALFAAGDSDTDITFLQDATGLKLAINRNKKELMCNAYANAGGKWIVNPMFIQPRAQQTAAYPCSTTACVDAAGASVACLDENGALIPDQADSVF